MTLSAQAPSFSALRTTTSYSRSETADTSSPSYVRPPVVSSEKSAASTPCTPSLNRTMYGRSPPPRGLPEPSAISLTTGARRSDQSMALM